MKIQLVAPWHSMDEMPEFERQVLVMCYQVKDLKLNVDWSYVIDSADWDCMKDYVEIPEECKTNNVCLDVECKGFAWCYLIDLAAMEFNRMLVKETSHGPAVIGGQIIRDGQIINIRGGGSGGSGYSRTGSAFVGGSGSGGSSHGSSFSSVGGGVCPGWGVAGDMSQMRWPIGGMPGVHPQEKAEKEQD